MARDEGSYPGLSGQDNRRDSSSKTGLFHSSIPLEQARMYCVPPSSPTGMRGDDVNRNYCDRP